MSRILFTACLITSFLSITEYKSASAEEKQVDSIRVYVGTYTRKGSEGIYTFELNPQTGKTTPPRLAAKLVNPSFVAISPSGKFLYSVNEVSDFPGANGKKAGGVSSFAMNAKSGTLTKLNSQISGGAGPCHLSVDQTGKCVIVANYGGGSVASLPVKENGELEPAASFIQHEGSSINPRRQEGPHAHSANVDAGNNFVVVADLGLDKLMVYKLDAKKGTLTPSDPPYVSSNPGAGPRHFSFHPNGKFAYVCNEMQSSVTAYDYDAKQGVLTSLVTLSTLPEDYEDQGNSTAEALVHPSGNFLYVSNRVHDSIAMYKIKDNGTIKHIGNESTQGKIPRNFGIDPTGKYLLASNQDSNTIVVFAIDQSSGKLNSTGTVIEVPTPVCVRMLRIE